MIILSIDLNFVQSDGGSMTRTQELIYACYSLMIIFCVQINCEFLDHSFTRNLENKSILMAEPRNYLFTCAKEMSKETIVPHMLRTTVIKTTKC